YHGSVYLSLKLEGELLERTFMFEGKTGITAVIVAVIAVITAFLTLQLATKPLAAILAILAVLLLAASVIMIRKKKSGIAMLLNGIVIVFGTAALFSALFPNVMVSSLDSAYNLTVYNASSSPYTLKVMTIVACTVLPIVLAYTAWVYWVFRKRIQSKDLEY
ncbi:MAG: cytochrome d ubiquinol oxidase subunit II, partial [Clostridiales bacterium]|nr:cytochrome d ubiquinol oxidase subunit II [Clostridiales bacterium]